MNIPAMVAISIASRSTSLRNQQVTSRSRSTEPEPAKKPTQKTCKRCTTKFGAIHQHCPRCGTKES